MAVAWSATTITAMYGILAVNLLTADYLGNPLFGHSAALFGLSQSIEQFYVSDRVITVGVMANLFVLIGLGAAVIRSHMGNSVIGSDRDIAVMKATPVVTPQLGPRLGD